MIYLLGGAPPSGKSILARRINRETGLPTVSTDLLRGVLMQVDRDLCEASQRTFR
jgi:2-phosphoglycerate kinase